ncbi:conserved domain protein [Haemophilus pittmaniae HK 85]|uniref:Conserved domain protein n=1 Tax=Haemophilus pittmaniae HK 85 TaxID=1035188 RepID=F9Q6H5_9PAST|nr:conserved domain protein [Haemophilus pittmaniae HK 85]
MTKSSQWMPSASIETLLARAKILNEIRRFLVSAVYWKLRHQP